MKNHKLIALLISLTAPLVAGAVGSAVTYSHITGWYASLAKPVFSPPNWVFGPVWTILYILMGLALYYVWTAPKSKKYDKAKALQAFWVQLALNVLWSVVFFGLQSPWLGVITILALLLSILLTVQLFQPISKKAAYLLVPYVLWVSFATVLNTAVAALN